MEPMAAKVSDNTFMYTSSVQIKVSDMDLWSMGIETMQLRHDLKMYPPRVKMTVSMKSSDVLWHLSYQSSLMDAPMIAN